MTMRKAFLLGLMSITAFSASSEPIYDGHDIARWTGTIDSYQNKTISPEDLDELMTFTAYISGVYDFGTSMGYICTAQPVTKIQLARIVGNFNKEQPDRWGMPAGLAAMVALEKAFPCNKE